MPVSVAFIKRLESVDPQLRSVLIAMLEEIERQREESVTKREFNELRDAVKELAQAQTRTEQRLEELAEAQKKTEARLDSLAQKVEELTEAQKRTEARVEELAEAQKKTETRVEELAEAQKRTEEEIRALARRLDVVEERVEGISNSVGYSLENRAYGKIPLLLRDRFGIEIDGRLVRKYVTVGSKFIQVNIYGYGRQNGRKILILGECKVRPSKKEILRFEKYAEKISTQEGLEIFPLVVAHDFPPPIEEFLKEKNIPYFWSYELEE
ncbi:MAG: hypothetical protein JRI45_03625 [Deltaproteobacteria bacterium]|nr:hypothetical protein [Deltaproteobacteria bacterium]MBW2068913.1 hypothetical protein [Deltaproteobacteria bacterium]